jgi:hypothetical protein
MCKKTRTKLWFVLMIKVLTLPYTSKCRAMAQLYASKELVQEESVEITSK